MSTTTLPEMPSVWNRTEVEDYLRQLRIHSRHAPGEVLACVQELERRLAPEFETEPFLRALVMAITAESSDYLGMPEEMFNAMEKAIPLLPQIQEPKQRAHILNFIGVVCHFNGRLADAQRYYQEAHDVGLRAGITGYVISNTRSMGTVAQTVGEYNRALDYYLRALELVDETTHQHVVVALFNSLAQIYSKIGDSDKALEYYDRTLTVARQHQERVYEADALSGIADLYLRGSRVHEAIELLSTASEIWSHLGDGVHYLDTLSALVKAHLMLGNVDLADEIARKALEIARKNGGGANSLAWTLMDIAIVLERREDFRGALEHASQVLEIARSVNSAPLECDVRDVLARICARLGEFEKGYEHRARWGELLVEQIGEERQKEIANMEVRHAIEIDRREREMLQLRAQRAEQTVERQFKDLSAAALALTKRNEALQNLRTVIQPLIRNERGRARSVASIILERIEEVMTSRDEWGVFEEQFERVHHDFIVRLRERCAILTPTEIRVCVLLRLNLPTKQIADVLCSSPDTIKVHRKHIRKKLDVDVDDNLTSLLLSL